MAVAEAGCDPVKGGLRDGSQLEGPDAFPQGGGRYGGGESGAARVHLEGHLMEGGGGGGQKEPDKGNGA